jgi:hypothetical protein
MTRLGSVLGAILADVARARVVSDELTRDLAEVYRADTVLGSMSVPRLVIDQAELTLRFAMSEITEPPPSPRPDAPEVRDAWARHVDEVVVPRLAARLELAPEAFAGVGATAATAAPTRGTRPVLERAIEGDTKPLATATAAAMSDVFPSLPDEDRKRLRNKTAIKTAVQLELEAEARSFVAREIDLSGIRAVLASTVDVEVRSRELPSEPSAIQEMKLTIRGADLDTLITSREPGGG